MTGYYLDPANPGNYLPVNFQGGRIRAIPEPAPGIYLWRGGIVLSQSVKDFIEGLLNADGAAPDPPVIKNVVGHGSAEFREEVESGLRELLRSRELTLREYVDMTGVDFDSERELYDYLQKVCNYLFRGSDEIPLIPYPG
jgi:hypothetical protein